MEEKKTKALSACAFCELEIFKRICYNENGAGFKGCPTVMQQKILALANKEYEIPEIQEFARQASVQEAECYVNRHQKPYIVQPAKTRIIEICEFAKKLNYKRLGLAFCMGLTKEASVVVDVMENHRFEVVSVICKAGRIPKEEIGLKDEEKIYQGSDEPMCNPIFQAQLLNYEKTEFNILLGLCVGHDSLFYKYSKAQTTVLAVKDRVTGHNPLAAIYTAQFYYQKIKHPGL